MTWQTSGTATACETALLEAVRQHWQEGITSRDLQATVEGQAARSTVCWYIARLRTAGLIRMDGKSIHTRYFPCDVQARAPLQNGLAPNSIFQLADRMAAATQGRPCA